MPTLSKDLRNRLARVTLAARGASERACRAALENLAVHEKDYRGHMSVEQRLLRNKLRARGRALGDTRDERSGAQDIRHLAEDASYEHWHRLLFTRFLTENNLLNTDESQGNVPVTLQDCEELAPELGARDGFELACRFASKSLPGVFRSDDPVFALTLALNDQVELRKLLESLPTEVFTASDSLGWTYQFWQAERKDQVNAAGNKIGADELPSVTQLFTEDYMVDFLLDNTLGAWWAGKQLALNPQLSTLNSEDELRQAVALPGCPWKYLRFIKGKEGKWTPAAGTFDGWPKSAAALRALDPCMGSGHFVVAMFERLVALRLAEEELDEAAAVAAVIRDNLFGLEIDPRCTQIGAFNLALAAWRRVGHCKLPAMNLACSGLAPNTREADWLAIAGDNQKLQRGMERLYRLFQKAAVLGSLINPRAAEGDLLVAAFHELQPLLEKALAQESKDDTAHEMAVTARGLAKVAEILAGQFTLVATNVPYLGRGKQDDVLQDYCDRVYPAAKTDLATCFVERCLDFCTSNGSTALVTPQGWLFLAAYKKLREGLLRRAAWDVVARLGAGAFEAIGGEVVNVSLLVLSHARPISSQVFLGIDVAAERSAVDKATALSSSPIAVFEQIAQLRNPDGIVTTEFISSHKPLGVYAHCCHGLKTADDERFRRNWWELPECKDGFEFCYEAPTGIGKISAQTLMVRFEDAGGRMEELPSATIAGKEAWGKRGVVIARMSALPCAAYYGEVFKHTGVAVVPKSESHFAAIWEFSFSGALSQAIRQINQALAIDNGVVSKVPFDLAHWQKVAAKKYPHGLPKPISSDPTQWLFNGHPAGADQPLHVAVARLLGYQWPRQTGSSFPDCPALGPDGLETLADDDGIVCLPPLNREQPAANRLRELLAKALGKFDERALVAATGSDKTNFEDWLRDDFFEQHCDLFHQRPFLWHIWDGRKDGFHALVNYHKLDHDTLQKLTYSYLGDWMRHQEEDAKAEKPGADARLGAARALQAELGKILTGEAPYDIFVRWKPLAKQATGWHPDLNDGVRLNIRPFLSVADVGKKGAGILRSKPGVKWDKDRGKEPQRDKTEYPWFWCEEEPGTDPRPGKDPDGNRWNDVHLTLAVKKTGRTS